MQIAKLLNSSGKSSVGIVQGSEIEIVDLGSFTELSSVLATSSPAATIHGLRRTGEKVPVASAQLLPPIDAQEVWAAGVTYKRSQTARMEESETAASCYDRVYNSPRPEIFFKATPHRVRGTGQALRIRKDATWNVPEPN